MTFEQLNQAMGTAVFTTEQVNKIFPADSSDLINVQLNRFAGQNKLLRLKRGVYKFLDRQVDDMVVAGALYSPSYVSLESALKIYGLIDEEVMEITSVTTTTSKKISGHLGVFSYAKILKSMFFGYKKMVDPQSGIYYNLAEAEKALLDFIYIRKIKDLKNHRIDLAGLNKKKLLSYSKFFPAWVRKEIGE